MKAFFFFMLLSGFISEAKSQRSFSDSLLNALNHTSNDTEKLVILTNLSTHYFVSQSDTAIFYARQQAAIAHSLHFKIDEAYSYDVIGFSMFFSDDPHTLESLYKGISIAEDPQAEFYVIPASYLNRMQFADGYVNIPQERRNPHMMRMEILADLYFDLGHPYGFKMENVEKQWHYYEKAKEIYEEIGDSLQTGLAYSMIGLTHYSAVNQYDSAIFSAKKGQYFLNSTGQERWIAQGLINIGHIYHEMGKDDSALKYYEEGYRKFKKGNFPDVPVYIDILGFYIEKGEPQQTLKEAVDIFELVKRSKSDFFLPQASTLLAKAYKAINKNDSAFKYYEYSLALTDSSDHIHSMRQFQNQDNSAQKREQELEAARIEVREKVKFYSSIAGLAVMFLIAGILYRNSRNRRRTNILLEKQKGEIQSTLSELKATQSQLIQSEKMASLGELTAGIAHEIQNPLNFVNNFSEVNVELIEELQEKRNQDARDQLSENELLNDIKENALKINHHGKRADAIVKGMLLHAQSSTGKKEPTDINALAEEYLRLSYNGIRAKDQSFNAHLKTNFDASIGIMNLVPQDIGRVLLNLYNNAFYAVGAKNKLIKETYEPIVSVSTKRAGNKVSLSVHDNGNGIPKNIVDKIFQPFFTTKPTGQGTGLGLSLSYDLIKALGGEIKVETVEGDFTEFIIFLPA